MIKRSGILHKVNSMIQFTCLVNHSIRSDIFCKTKSYSHFRILLQVVNLKAHFGVLYSLTIFKESKDQRLLAKIWTVLSISNSFQIIRYLVLSRDTNRYKALIFIVKTILIVKFQNRNTVFYLMNQVLTIFFVLVQTYINFILFLFLQRAVQCLVHF